MHTATRLVATLVATGLLAPSEATAQAPEAPRLSVRAGCHHLTGSQCNAKRRKIHRAGYPSCNTWSCAKRVKAKRERRARRAYRREWRYWTTRYIPPCTWGNESSHHYFAEEFALWRYSVMNSTGSGARGKYQMMSGTYHAYAKYGDWSKLDQEIAAHRLYWSQGTSPWSGCNT